MMILLFHSLYAHFEEVNHTSDTTTDSTVAGTTSVDVPS